MFGRKPNLSGTLQKEPPGLQYTYDNCIEELLSRLQSTYELAKSSLITRKEGRKEGSKEQYDKTVKTTWYPFIHKS
jgi:hypothetical protein